jgi:mycothione reductase
VEVRVMKEYGIIVVGSGSGAIVVEEAVSHGLKVALVDKGPLGGTCLNVGCIPSKMLIYPADRIVEIQEAGKFGINAEIKSIDFKAIMQRMRKSIGESRDEIREDIIAIENLDYYEAEGHFIDDYTIEAKGDKLKGEKIVIASGSRTFIPPIKGLENVSYLTNETLLDLTEKPESLIIVGGGYIAVEYGHFFAAMGTRVTILEMADRLVLAEEPEISEALQKQLSHRIEIHINSAVTEVNSEGENISVVTKDNKTGKERGFTAQKILIAVGRRSNADLLKVENTGVETDKRGFIKVNEYLETTKKNIFAIGDANGQQMFTHVANMEASLVVENILHNEELKMDYTAAPHAVYSHPQIASVGLTEGKARENHKILVGRMKYSETAKGDAMLENEGFAKVIIEDESYKILGFHIIGPYAPELIQEVINAMTSNGQVGEIGNSMHIHPAMSELIQATIVSAE